MYKMCNVKYKTLFEAYEYSINLENYYKLEKTEQNKNNT